MKINNKNLAYQNLFFKKKIFKINFLNSKIYQKKHFLTNLSLNKMSFFFKIGLKLIYNFHMQKKKIMFVGFPLELNRKLSIKFKYTNHIFMPQLSWVSGEFTNYKRAFFKKSERVKSSMNQSFLFKKTPDLIVIVDSILERKALKECFLENLPVISLNSDLNPFSMQANFHVPGNFICQQNKFKNNFFYSILCSIFLKNRKLKKFPFKYNKQFFLRKFFFKKNYSKSSSNKLKWGRKNSNYSSNNNFNKTLNKSVVNQFNYSSKANNNLGLSTSKTSLKVNNKFSVIMNTPINSILNDNKPTR